MLSRFNKAFPVIPLTADPISAWLGNLKYEYHKYCSPKKVGQPIDQETKWSFQKCVIAFYHFLERRYQPVYENGKLVSGVRYPVYTEERIKLPRKVRPVLTAEDLGNVLKACETRWEKIAVKTLIDSKVRVGELVSLDRESLINEDGKCGFKVKGKVGERIVPISPETYEELCSLSIRGPIFRLEGKRIRGVIMSKHIHKVMLAAGLTGNKLGPHILRHSASVLQYKATKNIQALKNQLGHTTLRMTEKYAELSLEDVREDHEAGNVLGMITGQKPNPRPVTDAIAVQPAAAVGFPPSGPAVAQQPGMGEPGLPTSPEILPVSATAAGGSVNSAPAISPVPAAPMPFYTDRAPFSGVRIDDDPRIPPENKKVYRPRRSTFIHYSKDKPKELAEVQP